MNKKGFTLIELIMVIAILGVLAAYAVPKLFDMTGTAQTASLKQIRVEIDSALRMYGLNELAINSSKSYPDPSTLTKIDLLDESEAKLTYDAAITSGTGTGYFEYDSDGDGTPNYNLSYSSVADTSSYTLGTEFVTGDGTPN